MCHACWLEFGSPAIDTPAVRAAARAVAEVDPYGNLHIVVDDWNLDDDNLDFCAGSIEANDVHESSPADLAAERHCLELLRGLTEDERASALALYEGFWTATDPTETPAPESSGDFLRRVGTDGRAWAEAMHERFPAIPAADLHGWCCNMLEAGRAEAEGDRHPPALDPDDDVP